MKIRHCHIFFTIISIFVINSFLLQTKEKPFWAYSDFAEFNSTRFIENNGQLTDNEGNLLSDVKFYFTSGNMTAYFTPNSIIYTFTKQQNLTNDTSDLLISYKMGSPFDRDEKQSLTIIRNEMKVLSANPKVVVSGVEANEEVLNFYYSHCSDGIFGVKTYKGILYRNLYDSIDLSIYAVGDKFGFKYDFIVHPGAQPEQIKLLYENSRPFLGNDGSVNIEFAEHEIVEGVPFSYQSAGDNIKQIETQFHLDGNILSYKVGDYDRKETLIIDPVINWSTYYGGSLGDHSESITLDNQANVIITGTTVSRDLPVTDGSTYIGEFDIFVAKFDYTGKRIWATYYGGKGADFAGEVAVDAAAHIYITGWTWSKNFPVTKDCFQTVHLGGLNDGILMKFTRNGIREWATYVGGYSDEHLYGLAIDNQFNVLTTGWSRSRNFPNDLAPLNPKKGLDDIVLVSFNSDGAYQWSTFLGGDSIETANEIRIDYSGNINIIGSTHSRDFKVTSNAHQLFNNGYWDAVIAKFSIGGTLLYSSYFGGRLSDYGTSLGIDSANYLFITGYTTSKDFPVSDDAYQKTNNGFQNAFITKFKRDNSVAWSTYLGGSKEDYSFALTIDRDDNVLVTGKTLSQDFPVTQNAVQGYMNGASDAFGAKFSNDGKAPFWITFYGGDDEDWGNDLAVDYYYNIYITGDTKSTDFPTTDSAFQKTLAGQFDCFIFKHCATSPYSEIEITGKTTFCDGGSVELDAGPGFLFYEWSSGETTQKITVTKSGSYSVHITDTMYCDFTTSPVFINVLPLPTPEIQGNPNFCEGDSAVLSVSSGYVSWEWSTGSTDETIVLYSNQEIILSVTDANGCTGFDTASVTRNPKPKPLIRGSDVVCANSKNNIYSVYGQAGHTYQWEIINGTITTGQDYFNIQVDWTTAGIGRLIITEIDNATGCVGVDTMEIIVSDHLEPIIVSDKGRFVMCEGDSMVLDAGYGFKSYEWNNGSNQQTIRVHNAGTYSVKVEADGDCIGYDTVVVTIRPIPAPEINGDSILCEGALDIQYSSSDKDGHIYYWEISNGNIIDDDSTNSIRISWLNSGTGIIKLIEYDTLTECSGYAEYRVTINPRPMPEIIPDGETEFCEGDSLKLDVNPAYDLYLWSTGDTTQSIIVKTAGIYWVKVFNEFNCSSSDSIRITVWPRPPKPIITSIDDTLFSSPNGSYKWYRNDTLLTEITSRWFVSEIDGDYKVVHTNSNGCESESDIFKYKYIPIVGISDIGMPDSIFVRTGDPVVIPIVINSSNLLDKINAYKFTAAVSFDGAVLIPDDITIPYEKDGNTKTLKIEGTRSDTVGLIYTLYMHAALGDSICTDVRIDTLYWDSVREVQVTTNICVVCIINICNADGNRFFLNSGELRLEQNKPNPANESTIIEFEAIEEGRHKLVLIDIYGREISNLFDRYILPGIHHIELNTSSISSGVYYYTLTTPTQIRRAKMQILK